MENITNRKVSADVSKLSISEAGVDQFAHIPWWSCFVFSAGLGSLWLSPHRLVSCNWQIRTPNSDLHNQNILISCACIKSTMWKDIKHCAMHVVPHLSDTLQARSGCDLVVNSMIKPHPPVSWIFTTIQSSYRIVILSAWKRDRELCSPVCLSLMSLQLSTSPMLLKSVRISSWVMFCGR